MKLQVIALSLLCCSIHMDAQKIPAKLSSNVAKISALRIVEILHNKGYMPQPLAKASLCLTKESEPMFEAKQNLGQSRFSQEQLEFHHNTSGNCNIRSIITSKVYVTDQPGGSYADLVETREEKFEEYWLDLDEVALRNWLKNRK